MKVLVQLKLDDKVNNSFQYCEVDLPFPNRGNIINMEISPTAGAITLSPDKKGLKWNLGQKFTSRNKEVALPATIYFDGETSIEDPFLVGTNCFIKLKFKILAESLSGVIIESKSIKLFPPSLKPQIQLDREIISDE